MSPLPARPNLTFLRKQARNLHKTLQDGDPEARARLLQAHPRLSTDSTTVDLKGLGLVDSQLVIAREHGFDTWARMKDHILDANFAVAVAAIGEGDGDALRSLLEAHPEMVHQRSPVEPGDDGFGYFAGAMLLHYTAGNPTNFPLSARAMDMMDILLDAGADVNATTNVGHTTLSLAASANVARERGIQIQMLERLMSRGADPNVGAPYSALEAALMHGESAAGDALYSFGAHVDLRLASGLGRTDLMPVYFAVDQSPTRNAYELLPPLGEGGGLDISEAEVLTEALAFAVINWRFDAIDFLLEKGADFNAHDRFCHGGSHTPLHYACSHVAHTAHRTEPAMIEFLLSRGADPTVRDAGIADARPFSWAIHNRLPKIVAHMLEHGGCAEDLDSSLRHAVEQDFIDIAQLLVEAGANPMALQIAEEGDNLKMTEFLKEAAAK